MDLEMSWDKKIATVAAGDTVHFFDTEDFSELKRHTMPINFRNEGGASLHPGGKRFIAGGSDLWVRVFDFDTGAPRTGPVLEVRPRRKDVCDGVRGRNHPPVAEQRPRRSSRGCCGGDKRCRRHRRPVMRKRICRAFVCGFRRASRCTRGRRLIGTRVVVDVSWGFRRREALSWLLSRRRRPVSSSRLFSSHFVLFSFLFFVLFS
ncbi:unnamed protein product [Ectocarpus sp. 12 AP-2014]